MTRQPTERQVEAALDAWYGDKAMYWKLVNNKYSHLQLNDMRRALQAAFAVEEKDGEWHNAGGTLPCDEKCYVPPNVDMTEVPRPRHAWSDIAICPNCGRAWLMRKVTDHRPLDIEYGPDRATPSGKP